ncbi:MAG: hypothetical protein IJL32_06830 [Oscillospiraceae bacterium]|nr:hypothetical protein [Oscillospiraceae bacterium]
MTDRDLTNMMRDINPRFQQKANARAAEYARQHPHRSRMPGLVLGGAAACCALAAVLILLPKKTGSMHSAVQDSAPVTERSPAESAAERTTLAAPFASDSFDIVLTVAPAYAPYAMKLTSAQSAVLAQALTKAEWIETDINTPHPDGEINTVYVYNHGRAFSLKQYPDQTVELYRNDTAASSCWEISAEADAALRAAVSPTDPDSLNKQLVWCDPQTMNEADIWENVLWNKRSGCDPTSKDSIYDMICNSAEYYEQASGIVRCGYDGMTEPFSCEQIKCVFQTNLNSGCAYAESERYLSPNIEMLLNLTDDADYLRDAPSAEDSTGEASYALDPDYVWRLPYRDVHFSDGTYQHELSGDTVYPSGDHNAVHRRDYKPLTKAEQCRIGSEGEVVWENRLPLSNCGNIAAEALEGYTRALIYLYDFDSWDISGIVTLAGRECVSIKGRLNREHCESVSGGVPDIDLFNFFVDTQTGVIMKYLGYHSDGSFADFIVVNQIAFDEEAMPVQFPDLSEMQENITDTESEQ